MGEAGVGVLEALADAVGKGDRARILSLSRRLSAGEIEALPEAAAQQVRHALGAVLAEAGEMQAAAEMHVRALTAMAGEKPEPRAVLREIDALIAIAEARGDCATAARLQAIAVELTRTVEGPGSAALLARLRSLSELRRQAGDAAGAASAAAAASQIASRGSGDPPQMPDAAESGMGEAPAFESVARKRTAAAAPAAASPAPSPQRAGEAARRAPAAETGGAASGEAARGQCRTVDVFFATSRKPSGSDNPYRAFSGRRNESTTGPVHSYGIAEVSIPAPDKREVGALPVPGWLNQHAGFQSDAHFLLKRIRDIGRSAWEARLRAAIGGRPRREALIYVHGFNTDFWEAMVRAAQLYVDLQIDGAVATYSWPSRGNVLSYLADRQEIIAPHIDELKRIIRFVARDAEVGQVTIVAHSMGCEFMLPALEKLQLELAAVAGAKLPLIKDVIFAAPDVDVAHFAGIVPKLNGLVGRVSVYTSEKDQALTWGRWLLSSYDRAGNQAARLAAALHGRADTIDTTEAAADVVGHTDYASSAIDDLRAVVWLSLLPERRPALIAQKAGDHGPAFWAYRGTRLPPDQRDAFRMAMHYARMHGGIGEALAAVQARLGSLNEQPGPDPATAARFAAIARALTAMA